MLEDLACVCALINRSKFFRLPQIEEHCIEFGQYFIVYIYTGTPVRSLILPITLLFERSEWRFSPPNGSRSLNDSVESDDLISLCDCRRGNELSCPSSCDDDVSPLLLIFCCVSSFN